MRRSIRLWATTSLVVSALGALGAFGAACDTETILGNSPYTPDAGGGSDSGGGSSGGGSSGGDIKVDGGCQYTDNDAFCRCENWTCGGFTVQDPQGVNQVVYCGQCEDSQYCQPDPVWGAGVGACGGANPLAYTFQKQKIDMLVAMGENDNTDLNYGVCSNIGRHPPRGLTPSSL